MINTTKQFNIGDLVTVTGHPAYQCVQFNYQIAPIGSVGTVVNIRQRYIGTPNEYKQYKISFNGIEEGYSLSHLYENYNLKKFINK
jgi:hypothetical protein